MIPFTKGVIKTNTTSQSCRVHLFLREHFDSRKSDFNFFSIIYLFYQKIDKIDHRSKSSRSKLMSFRGNTKHHGNWLKGCDGRKNQKFQFD